MEDFFNSIRFLSWSAILTVLPKVLYFAAIFVPAWLIIALVQWRVQHAGTADTDGPYEGLLRDIEEKLLTDPALALLLSALSPLWAALFGRIFLAEALPPRTLVALALAVQEACEGVERGEGAMHGLSLVLSRRLALHGKLPPAEALSGPLCEPAELFAAGERILRALVFSSLYAVHVYTSAPSSNAMNELSLCIMRSSSAATARKRFRPSVTKASVLGSLCRSASDGGCSTSPAAGPRPAVRLRPTRA